jgi:hypothetical protein
MRGWAGRIEQRVGHPHVEHIIDTEVGVFEQMCSLGVYFKRVVIIKLFWIQWRVTHVASVVASTTFVYEAPVDAMWKLVDWSNISRKRPARA